MKFYLVKTETCTKCRVLLPEFEKFADDNKDIECEVINYGSSDKDELVNQLGNRTVPQIIVERDDGTYQVYSNCLTRTSLDFILKTEKAGE